MHLRIDQNKFWVKQYSFSIQNSLNIYRISVFNGQLREIADYQNSYCKLILILLSQKIQIIYVRISDPTHCTDFINFCK